MRILKVQQGTDEWLAARAPYHSSSEAPVMAGVSPRTTRGEMMRMAYSGDEKQFSRWVEEVLFPRGHQVEGRARPLAEKHIGAELFAVTGVDDDDYLLASYDGLTLLHDIHWECKQWSEAKAEYVMRGECPPEDRPQLIHAAAVVAGTNPDAMPRSLYTLSDGTPERTIHLWVDIAYEECAKLRAAWRQYDEDLKNYQPPELPDPVVGGKPDADLPPLRIEISGSVLASNLDQYRNRAIEVFRNISTELKTDQDFADAEETVKFCKEMEQRLAAAKDHALGQTPDIHALFSAIDDIAGESRKKRLDLEKLVRARKEARRVEIVQEAQAAIDAHYAQLNGQLTGAQMLVPQDFRASVAAAMKGKRTISSLLDAADKVLTQAKLDANAKATMVRECQAVLLQESEGYAELFPDRANLVLTKSPEDLRNLARSRIADAKAQEEERQRLAEQKAAQEAAAQQAQVEQPPAPPATGAAPRAEAGVAEGRPENQPDPESETEYVKLGDINAALWPITLTQEGLGTLGVKPLKKQGAAVLYAATDFGRIKQALQFALEAAQLPAVAKRAA